MQNVRIERKKSFILVSISFLMLYLAWNSIEAIPTGGKLNVHVYRDREYYVITVKDTGAVIPKDAESKLFMSMFTTKAQGQRFELAVAKRMTENGFSPSRYLEITALSLKSNKTS